MSKKRYVPHPGVYILDIIEEMCITQSEFAARVGLTSKNLSTLINGESNITFDVAQKLANFFDNSVEGWINLQTKYEIYKNEEIKENNLKEEYKIFRLFDKKFLMEVMGLEDKYILNEELIIKTRKMFNVSSLINLKNNNLYVNFKTSVSKEISEVNIIMRNAWISLAEQYARSIKVNPFNKDKLIENLELIRSLTTKKETPFSKDLKNLLESIGIKLVVLPYLKNSNISGVTKWNSTDQSIMIAINDYGKSLDKIWFTLFHELGHAIKNHKRNFNITYIDDCEMENEANNFAKFTLIPEKDYQQFIAKGHFSLLSINRFAKEIGVGNFIVVGRLQKDGFIKYSEYNDTKYLYGVDKRIFTL